MTEKNESRRLLSIVRENTVVPLTLVGISEKTLERVLQHLQEKDALFDHNVPKEMRDSKREDLQEFLVRKYLPRRFEIVEEEAVRKYIRVYDFVEFNYSGPDFKYKFYIKPGMKGIIKSVDLSKEHPLTVLWEPCEELPEERELIHTGSDLSLLSTSIFQRQKANSKIELLAEAAPGRLVEPNSTYFSYRYYLPVGTQGIVTKIDQSAKYPVSIVFGNKEGYIPPDEGIMNCLYSALRLSRENKFNIRKLLKELA